MLDPLLQFTNWMNDAHADQRIVDATAMTLATATATGIPSARIVLLKTHGPEGFTFYTNLHSRKSRELAENPQAALCFHWAPLERQVRIEGSITRGSAADADAYFASRPRERQIGAWASLQSEPLKTREELMARAEQIEAQYAGKEIPRPQHWSGWILEPRSIEFWHQSSARLHEREIYLRNGQGGWDHMLLNP